MTDKLLFWAEKATEFEEENKLLEQRINLLQIAGDEAIKQRNDALRERDEARTENKRLREALKHACIAVEGYSGSCPYDVYDSCQFPERCTDQYSECWQKYFDNKGHADFMKEGGNDAQ
jgi:hypothetical protein